MLKVLSNILCDLDPKVKAIGQKAGICDGVPSTSALVYVLLSSADFFQNQLFREILSAIPLECQKVWIQIRPNILSGLIWIQTVCKSYQQQH